MFRARGNTALEHEVSRQALEALSTEGIAASVEALDRARYPASKLGMSRWRRTEPVAWSSPRA